MHMDKDTHPTRELRIDRDLLQLDALEATRNIGVMVKDLLDALPEGRRVTRTRMSISVWVEDPAPPSEASAP